MSNKSQHIPERFIERIRNFDFLTSKMDFSKFLRPFLTHLDCHIPENATVWLLQRSEKIFELLNQKSVPKDLSEMFQGLI